MGEDVTITTVLSAGQFVTSGAQLVIVISAVEYMVLGFSGSTAETGLLGAGLV